jgi:hypothetical protein
MRRYIYAAFLIVFVTAAGTLVGCNDDLDDPTTSEGILTIESVDPVVVEADVTPTDPNGNPTPLTDDTTTVSLKNRPRNDAAGDFADIFIKRTNQSCSFGGNPVGGGTGIASFTIKSGETKQVTVVAVTVAQKAAAAAGDTWVCTVQFQGEDIAGNPAISEAANFVVSFADL